MRGIVDAKKIIMSSVFVLIYFMPIFAQTNTSNEEKLYTEFIKLKNAPEVRVSNEANNRSIFIDPSLSDKRYIIFRKIMNSVKAYLTPRGEIEIEVRSRTIIITDTASNIEFMKGIVLTYDYEEIYLPETEEDTKVAGSGLVPGF